MTKLDKAELNEYFEHVNGAGVNPPAVGFKDPKQQAMLVDALAGQGMDGLLVKLFELCAGMLGLDSAILSVFATGFQMGREYEDRHQTANELERLVRP